MGDDDAAARREARRKEREARRKEREAEAAADEESTRSRRRRRDEQQQEDEERQRREREREEEEAREREEKERQRRRREEQEAEERRQRQQEEEEANRRRRQREDEQDENEVDEKEETIFDTMSPQKKASILEGLADEFRRIVEQREAKGQMVAVSAQELDELDLKVRSLRTQVRKAEETNNQLTKQKREVDEKFKRNENELNKLRNELQSAEAENELAIKEGKKVAPKLPTGPVKKKASPPSVAPKPKRSDRHGDQIPRTPFHLRHSHEHARQSTLEPQTCTASSSARDLESLGLTRKGRMKEGSLEPVSTGRAHARTLPTVKTEQPEVKPKARWRSPSFSKLNEPVELKLQLPGVLSRDTVTSSQKMERRRHARNERREKITPKTPPNVKPKPWRAKLGDKELLFKDNVLTLELKTKLRARSLAGKGTSTEDKEIRRSPTERKTEKQTPADIKPCETAEEKKRHKKRIVKIWSVVHEIFKSHACHVIVTSCLS